MIRNIISVFFGIIYMLLLPPYFNKQLFTDIFFVLKNIYLIFILYFIVIAFVMICTLITIVECNMLGIGKQLNKITCFGICIPEEAQIISLKLFVLLSGIQVSFVLYGVLLYCLYYIDIVGSLSRRMINDDLLYFYMQTKYRYMSLVNFIIISDKKFLSLKMLSLCSGVCSDTLILFMNKNELNVGIYNVNALFEPNTIGVSIFVYNIFLLIFRYIISNYIKNIK